MKFLIIFTFIMNMVLTGSALKHMITLIRTLQLILHIPMVKIIMPG
jgi:hypothetical protein